MLFVWPTFKFIIFFFAFNFILLSYYDFIYALLSVIFGYLGLILAQSLMTKNVITFSITFSFLFLVVVSAHFLWEYLPKNYGSLRAISQADYQGYDLIGFNKEQIIQKIKDYYDVLQF